MTAFQKLGRYLILQEIAKGGMAVIYRGKLLGVAGFEKEVAIKKILPFWSQNEEFISMLIDEAKVLVELHHPNIVQVIELGKENESYFIVMEFVNGFDLRTLMRNLQKKNLKLPLEFITYITKQICLGLDFAHNKSLHDKDLKLVHRDISPQNILIGKEGEVKITDFGIAKTTQKSTQTQTGVLKGKFSYMSPEQAVGEDIDHQTDIFALGILFYEMLFDEKCFDGKNDFEIIEKVKKAKIHYPEDLADEARIILERSLAIDKSKRYQNAIDFYNDLEALEATLSKKAFSRDFCKFLHTHFADHFKKKIVTPKPSEEATALHKTTETSYKILTSVTEIADKTLIDDSKTQIQTGIHQEKSSSSQNKPPVFSKSDLLVIFSFLTFVSAVFLIWQSQTPVVSEKQIVKIDPQEKTPSDSSIISALSKKDSSETASIRKDQAAEEITNKKTEEKTQPQILKAKLKITTSPLEAEIEMLYNKKKQSETGKLIKTFEFSNDSLKIPVAIRAKNFHEKKLDVIFNKDKLVFEKEIVLAPVEYGKFYLYSRPWATFRIKDFDNKSYPSSTTLTLPVGKYSLSVYSPSQKRSSGRKIEIQKDQTLSCLASFAARSTISCRYK